MTTYTQKLVASSFSSCHGRVITKTLFNNRLFSHCYWIQTKDLLTKVRRANLAEIFVQNEPVIGNTL